MVYNTTDAFVLLGAAMTADLQHHVEFVPEPGLIVPMQMNDDLRTLGAKVDTLTTPVIRPLFPGVIGTFATTAIDIPLMPMGRSVCTLHLKSSYNAT